MFLSMCRKLGGKLGEKKLLWFCLTLRVTNRDQPLPRACGRDHKAGGLDPSCVDLLALKERSLARVEATNHEEFLRHVSIAFYCWS